MRPDASRLGFWGWIAGAMLAWCTSGALAGEPTDVAPAHLTRADAWASPDGTWDPPHSLQESSDAVLSNTTPWHAVDLPHARERSTVSTAAQANAPPEVWWYRLQVPGNALATTPQGPRLYIPRWQTVGTAAVYANGRLVWQSHGSRVWNGFNRPVWVDLTGDAPPDAPLEVHVRMANLQGVGGALSTVWVGPAEALSTSWRLRRLLQTELVAYLRGAYLVLGVFALAMWFVRRSRGEVGYLLFFLLSVGHLLATLFYLVDMEALGVPDAWFSWLTLMGSLGSSVCSFFLLCLMQGQRFPRLARALLVYFFVIALAALPLWSMPHEAMLPLLRLALLPPALVVLSVAITGAWRRRSWPDVLLAGTVVLSFPLAFHDLAMQRYRISIEHIYLTPYVYMGVFTMFLLAGFARYQRALGAAEQSNAVLAERLAAQEQQLQITHGRLRAIEREQTLLHERQRLMREMHDGVGSSLISALRLVEATSDAPVDVAQVLRECIDDLKISIDSLEPMDADLLALLASLRYRLSPRLEGAGLMLHWQVRDMPPLPWLDAQCALHVLRILQEVLTNILKHSRATDITLSTATAPRPSPDGNGADGVLVCVRDNGRPFTPPAPEALSPAHRGLSNIRTRVQVLGAHCTWSPSDVPGEEGSVFTLWLPLHRQ